MLESKSDEYNTKLILAKQCPTTQLRQETVEPMSPLGAHPTPHKACPFRTEAMGLLLDAANNLGRRHRRGVVFVPQCFVFVFVPCILRLTLGLGLMRATCVRLGFVFDFER